MNEAVAPKKEIDLINNFGFLTIIKGSTLWVLFFFDLKEELDCLILFYFLDCHHLNYAKAKNFWISFIPSAKTDGNLNKEIAADG